MSKTVLVITTNTGVQAFNNAEEYTNFLDSLVESNPHLAEILKYNDDLRKSQVLLFQAHEAKPNDNAVLTAKTFATHEAALEYQAWISSGEGKDLVEKLYTPLNWSLVSTNLTTMTDERYAEIITSEKYAEILQQIA